MWQEYAARRPIEQRQITRYGYLLRICGPSLDSNETSPLEKANK